METTPVVGFIGPDGRRCPCEVEKDRKTIIMEGGPVRAEYYQRLRLGRRLLGAIFDGRCHHGDDPFRNPCWEDRVECKCGADRPTQEDGDGG